jgi:hypothetical protein
MRSSSPGISGFTHRGVVGVVWRMASKITADVLPVKAWCPVAIS